MPPAALLLLVSKKKCSTLTTINVVGLTQNESTQCRQGLNLVLRNSNFSINKTIDLGVENIKIPHNFIIRKLKKRIHGKLNLIIL